jgi:hypothetical protein
MQGAEKTTDQSQQATQKAKPNDAAQNTDHLKIPALLRCYCAS